MLKSVLPATYYNEGKTKCILWGRHIFCYILQPFILQCSKRFGRKIGGSNEITEIKEKETENISMPGKAGGQWTACYPTFQQHVRLRSHQLVLSDFSSLSWIVVFLEAGLSAFAEASLSVEFLTKVSGLLIFLLFSVPPPQGLNSSTSVGFTAHLWVKMLPRDSQGSGDPWGKNNDRLGG